VIVYEDEASFRQSPTLHQTWARRNSQPQVPSTGQRNSQKVFGAVAPEPGRFAYRQSEEYFNYETYVNFLDGCLLPAFYRRSQRIYLIQDNASYHKKPETYEWFAEHRRYIEVFNLPPYSPELNAAERIWGHTRKKATHNRYFETKEMLQQALASTFRALQRTPRKVRSLTRSFFCQECRN